MFRPNKLFLPLIALFVLLLASQLATGVALFYLKWGFSLTGIQEYYWGQNGGRAPLSWLRLLETALPHLVAMGTVGFILTHFLAFTDSLSRGLRYFFAVGLFVSIFLNIGADFAVRLHSELALLKLASFLLFQFFFFAVGMIILKSSLSSPQRQASVRSMNL